MPLNNIPDPTSRTRVEYIYHLQLATTSVTEYVVNNHSKPHTETYVVTEHKRKELKLIRSNLINPTTSSIQINN